MRVLINGAAGRIGRGVTYEVLCLPPHNIGNIDLSEQLPTGNLELVALNDPIGIDTAVESYIGRDPVHGIYQWKVEKINDSELALKERRIKFTAEKDITKVLKGEGIELVIECSGFYGDPKLKDSSAKLTPEQNMARSFLNEGVSRVIQTYPAKTADKMIIMGVNHLDYNSDKHRIISNASCTTKALAVPLQVLIDNGIEIDAMSMDTTHAATASQKVLESLSQIVTHSTGAAKATGEVIPSLKGRMSGMSYRVPTLDGSFANLYFVASSSNELSAERINDMMRTAVNNPKYAQRLGIFDGEDAGTFDIVGRRENGVVIPSKTSVIPLSFSKAGKKSYLVTLISGYDNELGSCVDPVLLADYIAGK